MKKLGIYKNLFILLGAILLAACAQAAQPKANPSIPTDNVAVSAPTVAPLATEIPSATSVAPLAIATATSSTPLKADACALMTKDEVSTVLGQAVDTAVVSGMGGVCTYQTKDFSFELTVISSGGIKYIQSVRTNLGDSAVIVAGLGDEAVYNPNRYTLLVRKGDAVYLFFVVQTAGQLTDEEIQAKDTALATQLFTHLN